MKKRVLLRSFVKVKWCQQKVVHFMRLLVAPVIHYMLKNRSLSQDFGFVYIKHEWFRCLSRYGKRVEDFEILRIWKNVASHAYGPVQ